MRRLSILLLPVLLVWAPAASAAESGIADDEEEATTTAEPSPGSKTTTPVAFNRQWLEPFFPSGPEGRAADRFRSGDFVGAAKELARVLAALPKSSEQRHPLLYLQGLALANQSSWQAAGDVFEQLWSSYPLLAPYHAYHAARCRLRRGDLEGSFTWLARVPAGSVPEPDAIMVKIDAFVAAKRWAEVDTEVTTYLARFAKGPRRAEAMFLRAQALQELGRPAPEIAAAYRKVWAEATVESWATRANERLEALAKAVPDQAGTIVNRTIDEQLSRGLILFDANQNAQAEAAFTVALSAPDLDKATVCKLRFHLAQSVWKQRQRQRAAPLFDPAVADCRAAGENDLTVRALYQGARSYSSSGDKERALALYAQIERDFPNHRLADDARLRAAEVLVDLGKDAEADKLLADVPDLYPKGDMAPEALWRLAFGRWQARDYDKALGWLDENLRRYPREDIWYAEGRALYWKARVFEKKGERKRARESYERAVHEYPLSVYTLFSLERMRKSFPEARAALLRELRKNMGDLDKKSPWEFGKQAVFAEPGFLRAVEFARMGLGSEARRELGKLGLRVGGAKNDALPAAGREDVYWITAILLDRGNQWHASHSIPRYTLTGFRRSYPNGGRHEGHWRLGYPKAFPDAVARNCRANKVPEALQWAIMREESSFYPRAESFANAMGLTQMMTRTAQRFAKWPVTREALFDPDKNLEVGSKFLAFLLEHYDGAVPLVISGYNAGEGGVDRWLRERGQLELDEFIETIPYDETRGYTKRVLSSYLTYAWLYQHDKPVPAIAFALKKPASDKPKATGKGSAADKKASGKGNAPAKKKLATKTK